MLIEKVVSRKLKNFPEIMELMKTAFPQNEQFPLWLLRLLALKKSVDFIAYYDGNQFAGVSYTVASDKMAVILFLAVNPNIRSKGYGSAILDIIKGKHKAVSLNIEPVREEADNYEQRKARQSFYERNGFYITGYAMDDRGVDYETMCNAKPFEPREFEDATAKLSFGHSTVKLYKR